MVLPAVATTSSVDGAGATAQRRGQRVGAEIDRQPGSLFVVEVGDQRQHRVGRGGEIGARIEHHRDQFEEHTLEQAVEFVRPRAVGAPTRSTSALTPSVSADSTAPLPSATDFCPGAGNASTTFQPDFTSRKRIAAADERPPTGQRRLGLRVEDGVERADREALIGRRVEKLLGLRAAGRPDRAGSTFANTPATAARQRCCRIPASRIPARPSG